MQVGGLRQLRHLLQQELEAGPTVEGAGGEDGEEVEAEATVQHRASCAECRSTGCPKKNAAIHFKAILKLFLLTK